MVDLAGSERIDESKITGEQIKETQSINKSLSCLGEVMNALYSKNSHIPYRNSKLTISLQDQLNSNTSIIMFVNISGEEDDYQQTLNTLKFASQVKKVERNS
jgi:hypothetical protein